ncbi:MAG: ribonuclease H-like domain-containing protein [Candidatus Pacearchaeota archaeon]
MELSTQELKIWDQELFQKSSDIELWSLDLETIPRQLNTVEMSLMEKKIREDYKPENLQLGNRVKPETIEKFYADKAKEMELKLAEIGKGNSFDPSTNIIVSYSMAHYRFPDSKLIQQIKGAAQILSYNGISYSNEDLNNKVNELNTKDVSTVNRILDRTKGDYPSDEDYKSFLKKLSEKLQPLKQIITFNGDGFDIPTIKWAFLYYDIEIPHCLKNNIDIQWFFSRRDYNGKWVKPSLKSVAAKYLGIEIFGEGQLVEEWWLAGEIQKIVQHNQEDAIATLVLANKIFKVDPSYFRLKE